MGHSRDSEQHEHLFDLWIEFNHAGKKMFVSLLLNTVTARLERVVIISYVKYKSPSQCTMKLHIFDHHN